MPTSTWVALANYTFAAGNIQTITVSSIPNTYRDLVFVFNGAQTTRTNENMLIQLNSDTGANYSWVRMRADTGAASDTGASSIHVGRLNVNSQSTVIFHVMDYSATDKHKTVLSRSASGAVVTTATAGRWASTNAVTSVFFTWGLACNFAQGSTLSIYGIVS